MREITPGGVPAGVLSLRLAASQPASVRVARAAAMQWLRDSDRAPCADDVMLVVSELVTNAVRHTAPGVDARLCLTPIDRGVLVEVEDGGAPVELSVQSPTGDEIGHRGLLLVAAVSQDWGVRPTADGKVVWAEVTYPG